jgi:hypothetical protein
MVAARGYSTTHKEAHHGFNIVTASAAKQSGVFRRVAGLVGWVERSETHHTFAYAEA